MDTDKDIKKQEFWRCQNPEKDCDKVLAGFFDGNELRVQAINEQEIVISDFGAAEITTICKKCGYKNHFNRKNSLI